MVFLKTEAIESERKWTRKFYLPVRWNVGLLLMICCGVSLSFRSTNARSLTLDCDPSDAYVQNVSLLEIIRNVSAAPVRSLNNATSSNLKIQTICYRRPTNICNIQIHLSWGLPQQGSSDVNGFVIVLSQMEPTLGYSSQVECDVVDMPDDMGDIYQYTFQLEFNCCDVLADPNKYIVTLVTRSDDITIRNSRDYAEVSLNEEVRIVATTPNNNAMNSEMQTDLQSKAIEDVQRHLQLHAQQITAAGAVFVCILIIAATVIIIVWTVHRRRGRTSKSTENESIFAADNSRLLSPPGVFSTNEEPCLECIRQGRKQNIHKPQLETDDNSETGRVLPPESISDSDSLKEAV